MNTTLSMPRKSWLLENFSSPSDPHSVRSAQATKAGLSFQERLFPQVPAILKAFDQLKRPRQGFVTWRGIPSPSDPHSVRSDRATKAGLYYRGACISSPSDPRSVRSVRATKAGLHCWRALLQVPAILKAFDQLERPRQGFIVGEPLPVPAILKVVRSAQSTKAGLRFRRGLSTTQRSAKRSINSIDQGRASFLQNRPSSPSDPHSVRSTRATKAGLHCRRAPSSPSDPQIVRSGQATKAGPSSEEELSSPSDPRSVRSVPVTKAGLF